MFDIREPPMKMLRCENARIQNQRPRRSSAEPSSRTPPSCLPVLSVCVQSRQQWRYSLSGHMNFPAPYGQLCRTVTSLLASQTMT